jgi:hypothetical protein
MFCLHLLPLRYSTRLCAISFSLRSTGAGRIMPSNCDWAEEQLNPVCKLDDRARKAAPTSAERRSSVKAERRKEEAAKAKEPARRRSLEAPSLFHAFERNGVLMADSCLEPGSWQSVKRSHAVHQY